MSAAKELHICTRYVVVAMLLTLKQSVCVHSQHQNLGITITVETPDLPILFPGSFTTIGTYIWLGCFSHLQAVHTTLLLLCHLCFASWPIHNQSRGVTISPNQISILDCVYIPYSIIPNSLHSISLNNLLLASLLHSFVLNIGSNCYNKLLLLCANWVWSQKFWSFLVLWNKTTLLHFRSKNLCWNSRF